MENLSVHQGIEAAATGDFQTAKTHFMAAVKAEPRNEQAWLLLGHVLENTEQQKTCYQRVLQINPNNQDAKISLDRPENPPPMANFQIPQPQSEMENQKQKPGFKLKPLQITLIVVILIVATCGTGAFLLKKFLQSQYFTVDLSPLIQSQNTNTADLPKSIELADGSTVYSDFGFVFLDNGMVVTAEPPKAYLTAMDKAEEHMQAEEYEKAIDEFNKVIEIAPHDDNAYYQRGACYWRLTSGEHSMDRYTNHLALAVKDMQYAIELNPTEWEYRENYLLVLQSVAYLYDMRIDRNIVFEMVAYGAEDALALDMPVYDELYLQRMNAEFLIESGHCQEGLDALDILEPEVPTDDQFYGGILRIRAKGQACLGQLDEAIDNISAATFNDVNLNDKEYKQSIYEYQAGKIDDAFQSINSTLERKPTFGGYRYYVRAILNYEIGNLDAAWDDLKLGENYTWDRTGLYLYAYGKLIMDDDEDTGLYYLQLSEATLTTDCTPMQEKIITELAEHGLEPLQPTPTVDLDELIRSASESAY